MNEDDLIFANDTPPPAGKVRFWVDDCQGGGTVEWITPEEDERREAWEQLTGKRYNDNTFDEYDRWKED
jgi:hypothetical protein